MRQAEAALSLAEVEAATKPASTAGAQTSAACHSGKLAVPSVINPVITPSLLCEWVDCAAS
jgi:hypothetical protein